MRYRGSVVPTRSRWPALAVALGLLSALFVAQAPAARAAAITVNTLADGALANNGQCTLREAITNANGNNQSGSTDCTSGSGADTISFSASILPGSIFLGSELPSVSAAGSTLSINGPGAASLTISGDTNNDNNVTANVRVIAIDSGASLNLSGVTISEGHAATFGGGIRNNGGTLTVASSTFDGNTADGDGGGIFSNNGTLTVTSSTFTGNHADSLGGGIWNVANAGTASVTSSAFTGNSADLDGGGIFSGAGPLTVTSSTFTGNTAGSFGGGIQIQAGSLTVTDCTFSTNFASNGGGIYVDTSQPNAITGSTFTGNLAAFTGGSTDNDGGGIYSSGTLTVSNSTLSNNDADDGGGIYGQDGALTVTNSTFSGNEADDDNGGGIYSNGTLDVTSSTFSLNDANGGGGAIFSTDTLDVSNSTFSANDSGSNGGGIYSDGTLVVTNSTFSGNVAGDDGGGILGIGFLTVTGSTFSGNDAGGGGGGIRNSATATVTNSTFSGNTAATFGGGIRNFAGTLTVEFSTLSGNGATAGGGMYNGSGATLRATIVANNSPQDCLGATGDGGYNVSSDGTCGFGGTSQSNANPQLEPLADNGGPTQTMALPESSPAANVIPVGQPAGAGCGTAIDVDQRGFARPEDDRCEIGAYEIQDPAIQPGPGPGPAVPPPDATSMSPTSGPVGTQVTIGGTNLGNATVRFNGAAGNVTANSPGQIVVTVPQGATTGPVVVSTGGGSDTAGIFTVTTSAPAISGFVPTKGKVGTHVVITGTNFTGTQVSFGGVPAIFVVDSPTQITAVVPPHAGTAPVSVSTAQGTGTSAGDFVVTHARTVGLHFSAARGSVGVTDGFSACASGVLVRLQLLTDGGFRTVASTSTTAHGAYRFGGVEPGSYRVAAKKVTLPSGDVCLRATSPVVRA